MYWSFPDWYTCKPGDGPQYDRYSHLTQNIFAALKIQAHANQHVQSETNSLPGKSNSKQIVKSNNTGQY